MQHFNDNIVKRDHLLKRSILLIKAWFTYEASLIGSQNSNLATYALYTLILYVLNNYSKSHKLTNEV